MRISFDYKPNEVVRVTILLEENADKQDVIDAVGKLMKNEPSYKVIYTNLSDDVFTAEVAYGKIDMIKEVDGVQDVTVTKTVGLHEDKKNEDEQATVIQPTPQQNAETGSNSMMLWGAGCAALLLIAAGYCWLKRKG